MTRKDYGIKRWLRYSMMKATKIDKYLRGKRWHPVIEFTYGLIAPVYDMSINIFLDDYDEVIAKLLQHISLRGSDIVLDIGCGTGAIAIHTSRISCLTVGFDLSSNMLRQLANKHQGKCLFAVKGNAMQLPFPDKTFDKVVIGFMFIHLNDDEKMQVFKEVYRVLKPGGSLGCLSGRDTITSLYLEHNNWQQFLNYVGFLDIQIIDVRDIYRYVISYKP